MSKLVVISIFFDIPTNLLIFELRNKIETFRSESKTRKALQLTLVTTYGLKPGKYSSHIQSVVTLDDLFAE